MSPLTFRAKAAAWFFGEARCPLCGDAPLYSDGHGPWADEHSFECCVDADCVDGVWKLVGGIVATGATYEEARAEWNARAREVA